MDYFISVCCGTKILEKAFLLYPCKRVKHISWYGSELWSHLGFKGLSLIMGTKRRTSAHFKQAKSRARLCSWRLPQTTDLSISILCLLPKSGSEMVKRLQVPWSSHGKSWRQGFRTRCQNVEETIASGKCTVTGSDWGGLVGGNQSVCITLFFYHYPY